MLEYALSWPRIEGGGLGGAWISRYPWPFAPSPCPGSSRPPGGAPPPGGPWTARAAFSSPEKREKEGWPMEGAVQVIWEREDRTLALEGEPVLDHPSFSRFSILCPPPLTVLFFAF